MIISRNVAHVRTKDPMVRVSRVVIVGSGFGGLAAAKGLAGLSCDVTIVDRTNHHLFQPLLYQVATASLSPADVSSAVRTIVRSDNVRILMDEVTAVDANAKLVKTKLGDDLPYDYLILATGADYSFFGNEAWARHAPVLKTLEDAIAIRERLLINLEEAERSNAPETAQALLTFVIVGAGPTGVEMAGAVNELVKTALTKDFKNINPLDVRIMLVEAGNRVLTAFPEHLSAYAREALERLGVEVLLGKSVSLIDQDGLVLDNRRILSRSVIWCAGTQARPAGNWIGADTARNRAIKVSQDCSVPGFEGVFAIGDVSSFANEDGKPLPGLAPVAKQQGRFVARLIANRVAGKTEPMKFQYRNWGSMAVIGRSHAVADFGTIRLKGLTAWLAWSLVHLMLLIDFRSRTSVYLNWAWAWFTRGKAARHLLSSCISDPMSKPADFGAS